MVLWHYRVVSLAFDSKKNGCEFCFAFYFNLNFHLVGLLFKVQYLDRMVFLGLGESGVCGKGISDFRDYGGWLVLFAIFSSADSFMKWK